MKRLIFGLLTLLFGLAILARIGLWMLDKPLPEVRQDPRADEIARQMMAAVDDAAWQRTGAVTWNFRGAHQHLWDRERSLTRVVWGETEALLDLSTWPDSGKLGVARRAGLEVPPEEAPALLEEAWSYWCNDSFWLNPIAKLFDDGTSRGLVSLEEGGEGMMVTYSSGGVTPGDSYLWLVGDDGLPTAWRMWTQILPLGGIETSWEGWTKLDTGALVATTHKTKVADLVLSDVRGAATLAELDPGAEDPFAELLSLRAAAGS